MRKSEAILEYNFTKDEEQSLFFCEIANWCWGKWGMNFDKIIAKNIRYIPTYNLEKKKKFLKDLKRICVEHDVDFRLKLWFYKSNYKFAKKIYKLMKSWTTFKERFWVAFLCFTLLCKYWRKFYSVKENQWQNTQ